MNVLQLARIKAGAIRHRWRIATSLLRNRLALRFDRSTQFPSGKVHTIAIGLTEHFGDIVACEPIVRYLRKQHPSSRIIWFTKPAYQSLIEHHPDIDLVRPVTCLTEWMRLKDSPMFDRVVDLHFNFRSCAFCDLPFEKTTGDPSVTINNYYEKGSLLSAFCQGAALPILEETPRVYYPPAVAKAVDALRLPDQFVVIHTQSNEASRNWSKEKWLELTSLIQSRLGLSVVEIGLKSTFETGDRGVVNLCGKLGLLESCEVIRRARLFVGVDSGPAHLSNAMGTYGVILLGQYRQYLKYMPYSGSYADGSNATVLQYPTAAADIPVNLVFAAVETGLTIVSSRKSQSNREPIRGSDSASTKVG